MFRSVLVANRGEIAARVLRALGDLGIRSVAVYSTADRHSPHLRLADEAICIGGSRSEQSYLNMEAVLEAALDRECQAIHPGFGFLSENARFAAMCEQAKVTFIGPSPKAIRMMGDKAVARETMRSAGLPPIPGSQGVVEDVEAAKAAAEEIGYPVLVKASGGGGGRGMRVAADEAELVRAFGEARMEAEKAFGNPELYLERFLAGGRHIEFQILADRYGTAIHLGERECSVQRHHQKLLEEALSSVVPADQRREMGRRVTEAVSRVGYVNAGTVEFLRAPDGALYFMEMNTRLQVEHPVTEMVTGVDIVKEQIAIAAGRPLSLDQDSVTFTGHAIEVRINAEDPEEGFRPSPGRIERFAAPAPGDGVRIDTHVQDGYEVPPFYDSMIAKLIVHAADRPSAIDAMTRALTSFHVEGVKTTIPFHLKVLATEEFRSGDYDTRLVETIIERGQPHG